MISSSQRLEAYVNSRLVRLDPASLLGAGGEGSVFQVNIGGQVVALKIYHQPSRFREQKLQSMLSQQWNLDPSRVAMPLQQVTDRRGQVIGLTMPYIGSQVEEVRSLANKKYRTQTGINPKQVAQIFADGFNTLQQIHSNGLIVGDLNDLNVLFRSREMIFIDVDAWQFDRYPCIVGTEAFTHPDLHGRDLAQGIYYLPRHDVYSMAVMLFKSLFLVHPYGGIHKQIKTLAERAQRRVSVFDSQVKYPAIGIPLDKYGDNVLIQKLQATFAGGSVPAVTEMADAIREFSNLFDVNGDQIRQPQVVTVSPGQITSAGRGTNVEDILLTSGVVMATALRGTTMLVVAHEQGAAIFYQVDIDTGYVQSKQLFKAIPGVSYQFYDRFLAVNPPHSTEVKVFDLQQQQIAYETETGIYKPARRAMLKGTVTGLLRLVNNYLYNGTTASYGMTLQEELVASVMPDMAWFTAADSGYKGSPEVFGFNRFFNQYYHWFVRSGHKYEPKLADLNRGEELLDIDVSFASKHILVRRRTIESGQEYLHTELIGPTGEVVQRWQRLEWNQFQPGTIHGCVFMMAGSVPLVLHATDSGLMQERIDTGAYKQFSRTAGLVDSAVQLYMDPAQKGSSVIAVGDGRVIRIMLA